jgi:hypothetical protein
MGVCECVDPMQPLDAVTGAIHSFMMDGVIMDGLV